MLATQTLSDLLVSGEIVRTTTNADSAVTECSKFSYVSRAPEQNRRYRILSIPHAIASVIASLIFFISVPSLARAQCSTGLVSLTPCNPTPATIVTKGSTGNTKVFTITSTNWEWVPTGCNVSGVVIGCSVSPNPVYVMGTNTFTVSYDVSSVIDTGSVWVTAVDVPGDNAWSHFTVQTSNGDFSLDTTTTNLTDQMLSLCANNCHSGAASFSTAPYYTLDAPRSATLVYTEERRHPRPVIYADVTQIAGTTTQYTLEATLNGTTVTFLNGDTKLYFSGSSAPVRLAGQMDASGYATGVYSLVVTTKATYSSGGTAQHSYSRPLVIVNESHSPLGRGWTIAGVQHVYVSGTSYAITGVHPV